MKAVSSPSKNKKDANGDAPDLNRALLIDAINSANLSRVRTVLTGICTTSTEAYKIACSRLLVELVDDAANDQSRSDDGEDTNTNDESFVADATSTKKRKTLDQRFEICEQCDQKYDVGENYEDSCVWHTCEYNSRLPRHAIWLPC